MNVTQIAGWDFSKYFGVNIKYQLVNIVVQLHKRIHLFKSLSDALTRGFNNRATVPDLDIGITFCGNNINTYS